MMGNPKNWLWFFLFGSRWRIHEAGTGEVLLGGQFECTNPKPNISLTQKVLYAK